MIPGINYEWDSVDFLIGDASGVLCLVLLADDVYARNNI